MGLLARNITKSFGDFRALDDVSLEVPRGKLVSLLGPSGSGKTTLLRILAGLEFGDPGTGGKVFFRGQDVTDLPAGKRRVGFVFQHYALFRHMTVVKNIAFGMEVRKGQDRVPRDRIRERVKELLGLVRLEGLGDRYPSELSGGQRQRVALARALAVDPEVLLLDEPFGALDAKVRKDLRRWLRKFQEQLNLTTVFVTHDQEEALELADEVVVMNHARIEQVGDPQHVYDRPASPFVIEFLGNVNRLIAGLEGTPGPGKDVLYVRPHDVDIENIAEAGRTYTLKARVQHVFSAGNYGRISLERLSNGEPFEAEISRERLRQLGIKPGDVVSVVFRHIRLFPKGEFYETDVKKGQIIGLDETRESGIG